MTSVTHKLKDESTSEITQRWVFPPSLHIYKNLPRITVFRKLKCPDPSMIPLPAEVKEFLQKSIRLTSYILIYLIDLLCKRLILHANKEICCSFKSFAGGTFGYSYREDRRCISQVVPLRSCKKRHFKLLAEIQKLKLILFCREPASSRRQKISMILQFALLIDQI